MIKNMSKAQNKTKYLGIKANLCSPGTKNLTFFERRNNF